MVTKEVVIKWLEQNKYQKSSESVWQNETTRYEVNEDHFRKLQRDKQKQWFLLEVTSFVDLFEQKNGDIKDKWHHVIGKNLSTYFQ